MTCPDFMCYLKKRKRKKEEHRSRGKKVFYLTPMCLISQGSTDLIVNTRPVLKKKRSFPPTNAPCNTFRTFRGSKKRASGRLLFILWKTPYKCHPIYRPSLCVCMYLSSPPSPSIQFKSSAMLCGTEVGLTISSLIRFSLPPPPPPWVSIVFPTSITR